MFELKLKDVPPSLGKPIPTEQVVIIGYVNYKGAVSVRRIIPKVFGWGANDYYPAPQFLLDAFDLGKNEHRTFALKNILFWRTENELAS